MAKEQEENKEIEYYVMNIIDDGKQLSIRIPSKIVESLQINAKEDAFAFEFDKKNLHLQGFLITKKDKDKIK